MDKALLLALAIPAIFLFSMGLIKSLVRHDFTWSSFYLGLDVALAALANGVVNLVDIGHTAAMEANKQRVAEKAMSTAEFLVFAFCMLLFTMIIHQRWEGAKLDPRLNPEVAGPGNRKRRGIWLGIISNAMGTGSLLVFILYKLRGSL